MQQAHQLEVPVTIFRKAHLSGSIIRSMTRCGVNNSAEYRRLLGGMVAQITIDGHVYTGEIETIAEALVNVHSKEEFIEAIGSASVVDDTNVWREEG